LAARQHIDYILQVCASNNPERQLKLGYSIIQSGGRIIRSVKTVDIGQNLDISVSDGIINSTVIAKKTMAGNKTNLNENLKKLAEISAWFNSQKELDLELGLEKVKEASALIKSSREQLEKLENEFQEIEKEFTQDQNQNSGIV